MPQNYQEYVNSYNAGEIELPESAVSNADGTVKYNMDWHSDREHVYKPDNPDYSVTDFTNDSEVLNAFEIVTGHLAENREIGSVLFDPATAGEQTDIAEFMRDDAFRIGTKVIKANILKDAPEEVKTAYRLMQTRWENSSISSVGETVGAIQDYGIDAVFNAESLGSVAAALFSRGRSIPADIAKRKAGSEILKTAIKASAATASRNPLTSTAIVAGTWGGADSLALQDMEIAVGAGRTEIDLTEVAKDAAITSLFGVGLHGAARIGGKYFSKGIDYSDEVPPTSEMFDKADLPKSAEQIIKKLDDGGDIETLDIGKFSTDIGGGEKTKEEIKDAIRLAISQEETTEGVRNKTKLALFKAFSNTTGNLFGKAAGVLSPYTAKSATAKVLQQSLSNEFGVEWKFLTPQQKVVGQDLGEVQREVTGGFSDRFRAIVEDISLHSAKGTLAEDVNKLLMLSLRGNRAASSKNLDGNTATAINTAAGEIRELYKTMGNSLQEIGVIDKLVPNYIPRMWDRKAIEANPEKLAQLLESKGGYAGGTGKQTVQDMLNIKDQIDSGGSGGHFFSAKRKLNNLENDADFQEFLNDDVLGSLHAYTFQAGKSIAKHRVLGVNTLADFQKLWTNRIETELEAKGEKLKGTDIERINLLYKTATGEGMERYGKGLQNGVDTYGFVNRIGMLGFATLSSLTEVFLNFSKAGVINSVKGFGEALEVSFKGITKDLESNLVTNHGLTAKEAFSEMRQYSIAMDQAMAQQGNRLAGDDLMNEWMQKKSNQFFRLTLLDQWTKFVQTTSYASGKNLITDNLKVLASYGGNESSKRFKTRAGELAELGIDYKEGLKWLDGGAKAADSFYKKSILGGAARYANSVVLQPTAMSGLKPLLYSNPKTAIAFQLLGYPVAFTNTVLKGAAKAMIKDPVRNTVRTLTTGVIMTEMARATNYWRSNGKSERNRTWGEIYFDALTRWGGNGILLDSIQRARNSSEYVKNSAPYFALPFGPIGSDAQKFYQQGLIPLLGGKVPLISGTYKGADLIDTISDNTPLDVDGRYAVHDYKEALKEMQEKVSNFLVKNPITKATGFGYGYNKGGEVTVPNAPAEPDERIDKVTGQPYNQQAGSAFMDETDPLKVMMSEGGMAQRQKYILGGIAKKGATALAETLSNKVDNLFNRETIDVAVANIDRQVVDIGINPDTPDFNEYVGALIDNNLEGDDFRSIAELEKIPEWVEAMTNQDIDKQKKLWDKARRVLGVSETKISSLEKIQKLQPSVDPLKALESVMPNSLGNLSNEYKRVRIQEGSKSSIAQRDSAMASPEFAEIVKMFRIYINNNTENLSDEGIEALTKEYAIRTFSSTDPSISSLDFQRLRKQDRIQGWSRNSLDRGIVGLDDLLTSNKDIQKILQKSNLLNEAIEYSDKSYSTLSEELPKKIKELYFQNKVADALTEAGYNSKKLDRWGYGAEMEKDGVTFSDKNPAGFYSLAEKVAKETTLGSGNEGKSYDQFIKAFKKGGVKQEELEWTGFIEKFKDKQNITRNQVTKFLKDNRLDVEETQFSEGAYKSYTFRGVKDTENYRTILLTLPKNKETPAGSYNESHFSDIDNPIAHLRLSDLNTRELDADIELVKLLRQTEGKGRLGESYFKDIITLSDAISLFRSARLDNKLEKYTDDEVAKALDFHSGKNQATTENKTLVLEELQSDVHMAGTKRGYTNKKKDTTDLDESSELTADERDEQLNDLEYEWDALEDEIDTLEEAAEIDDLDEDSIEWENITDAIDSYREQQNAIRIQQRDLGEEFNAEDLEAGPVPDMPFKSEGKRGGSWRHLGMKRVLIEAAKGDYDTILIPTGKEQIRRYPDVFNSPENPEEFRSLKNPTAMLRNYDVILPGILNNFGSKKIGSAEGKAVIAPGYGEKVQNTKSEYARKFRLTPEMKADILRGLPQFYAGGLMKRKAYNNGGRVLNTLRRARN